MPNIIFQFAPSGRRAIPRRTPSHAAAVMPSVLPATSPSMTPSVTAVAPAPSKASALIDTPALARAKIGTITKLTQGESAASRRSSGLVA